jgi:hypothetical protein
LIYQADITIPKNTTESSPTIVELGIGKGVITKFMVRPRPGHAGLAHCRIYYHESPIAPTTLDMDLHGDADPIDWEDHIEVLQEPFTLKILGWNTDDTYPHTFTIYVVILPKDILLVNAIVSAIAGVFRGIFPTRLPGGK